jgi:hypothetical protein
LRANIALSVRPRPQAPALNPEAIELTVTMPLLPSYLEKELAATLRRPGGFLTTSAAFTRLAQTASRGLVVMTPFIDAGGFRWLRRLFETTSVDCQKIVVLRDTDRYMVELGVQHADWLRALQVSVRDYHLSHICQALGIMPTKKYQNEGGPSPVNIIDLLRTYSTDRDTDLDTFGVALGFNWLIAGTDAHAKNHSLLLSGPDVRLAPLYDIASILPYDEVDTTLRCSRNSSYSRAARGLYSRRSSDRWR